MKIPENNQYVLFGGAFILANKLQSVADKKSIGLSTKQWFLMRNLQDLSTESPPTITMLAKETDTSRQNVSKMLSTLQKQGYVILRDSEADRRSQTVEMTIKGKEMLEQMAGRSTSFFAELFNGISGEEIEAAAKVVIKLIENLKKMQEDFE
jgi:MarR family transcriptional regulator for hemolysin